MNCDRCGKPTKEKIITSKKPETLGNKYTVLECLGGCRNEKYAYTFFPPKDNGSPKPATAACPQTQGLPRPTTGDLMLGELTEIRKLMQKLVESTGGGVQIAESECAPDEALTFLA